MPTKKERFRCACPICRKRLIMDKAVFLEGHWEFKFGDHGRIKEYIFIVKPSTPTGVQYFTYRFCPDCANKVNQIGIITNKKEVI